MSPSTRFFGIFAGLLMLISVGACDRSSDRMSSGEIQLAENHELKKAITDASRTAEDGEDLYDSLKALAAVYEAQGDTQTANTLRRHAVVVMGHCLDDKMRGLFPCPVREGDLSLDQHAGG